MSCLPESTYAIYVDGELDAEETRIVESHLVGCRSCRVLVSELRDETALLTDALQEREPAVAHPAREPAPDAGLALGLPLAVGGVALVLAVLTWLAESRLPGGLSLLNPLNLTGAYAMAFDFVFLLRDRAPGLVELALSLGAVAGVSALGSFALGQAYRRVAGPASLALAAALVMAAPDPSAALDVRHDQDVHITAAETVGETLVVTGDELIVEGVIEGDLVAGVERITVRGRVDGSIYAFTHNLEVSGEVSGGIVALSRQTRVGGAIGGNVYTAGESFTVAPGARLARDVVHFGDNAVLDGDVGRNVAFLGDWLEVRAGVGRDVQVLRAHRVALLDGARVEGDVDAVVDDGEIEVAPGATVRGEIRAEPTTSHKESYLARYLEPLFYLWLLVQWVASFLFGLALYAFVPDLFRGAVPATRDFFRQLGVGFVILVATPAAIAVAALSVIGLPVAALAFFVFATSLYAAAVVVSAIVGRQVRPVGDETLRAFAPSLLAGLGIVIVAVHLPFLGFPLGLVTLLVGLGMILEQGRRLVEA